MDFYLKPERQEQTEEAPAQQRAGNAEPSMDFYIEPERQEQAEEAEQKREVEQRVAEELRRREEESRRRETKSYADTPQDAYEEWFREQRGRL
jgi:hypothetical protein